MDLHPPLNIDLFNQYIPRNALAERTLNQVEFFSVFSWINDPNSGYTSLPS